MYENHWQLDRKPFGGRPAAEGYYPSQTHQAALLKLRYAVENRRAAAVLAGPSGVGKSMLLRLLGDRLPAGIGPVLRVDFTCLDAADLLTQIASQFERRGGEGERIGAGDAVASIERSLRRCGQAGQHPLLLVDEAHLLDPREHLEPLRQLLNIAAAEAAGESAWTILLCGMTSLVANLHRNPAMHDRVAVQAMLHAFSPQDTAAYVAHALRAAGCKHPGIFTADAVELIHQLTDGVPRRVNSLCDLALIVGFAQEARGVDAALVENVYAEMYPAAA